MCILFTKIMMGMISWCFYQKPDSAKVNMKSQSHWLIQWFFFPLLLVCTPLSPWGVFGYVFTVLLPVALQAFSWDLTNLEFCFWKRFGLKYCWKSLSYLTNISVLIKKDKLTSRRTSDTLRQMSEVVQKVSLNILTQVSVGHMVVVVVVVLLASLPSC